VLLVFPAFISRCEIPPYRHGVPPILKSLVYNLWLFCPVPRKNTIQVELIDILIRS